MMCIEMSNPRISNADMIPALLKPANTATTSDIGSTFLVPAATRAKARKESTMINAGRQALEEVGNRENGSEGGEQEGQEQEVVASAPVPALAPDRRVEMQTRLLQAKLKRLQEDAEASHERVFKRQRLASKNGSGVLGWRKGVEDANSDLDLASRVARMEADMVEDLTEEDSDIGQWIRKRLLLNLQEKERLLEQFVVLKKAHDREQARLSRRSV
jgi:hypothetical protein